MTAWLPGRLADALDAALPDGVPPSRSDWGEVRVSEFIEIKRNEGVRGSKILTDLAYEAGALTYSKFADGPLIAQRVRRDALADIEPIFSSLADDEVPGG
ncbi:MAG: hypothetical protein ACRENX_00375 [Candidatus Dormibacteria bacterium]